MTWFKHSAFGIALLFGFGAAAQNLIQPLQTDFTNKAYRQLSNGSEVYHSVSKPFLQNQFIGIEEDTTRWQPRKHKSWIMRKVRNEHLIQVRENDFYLDVDPVFNFSFGRDLQDTASKNLSTNTRGFIVQGAIGKKLSFYTSFYENQSFFPNYLNKTVDETGVVPGQGRTKPFKETSYDYNMASGVINYAPLKWINVQLGHGKNFIGDGYRSLILSDNTFNYPYLKGTFSFFENKLQYQVQYASLQYLKRLPATTSSEAQFVRQAGTFHSLSYSPHQMVELSLIEGVVYQNWDSTGTQPLPWNFYMPVIGLNTAVEGLNSSTAKPVLGLNLRVHPFKKYMFYAQAAIDQYKDVNTAFQFGIAAFDALNVQNLNLRAEWNTISKNMYGHQNPQNAFQHYGGNLAHPTGNDLNELIGIADYQWHSFFVAAKWVYSDRRYPVEVDLGNNIKVTVRQSQKVVYQDYSLGYLLNAKTNMKLKLGYSNRNLESVNSTEKMGYVYFAFLTDLQNLYYDF